mmetsp:Transcript_30181/g.44077  ORF Transcript_30181/g.44077 Transcript_30181/m.44077 type:complete len:218 (+) Transcript_30181:254-907(+)
MKVPRHGISGTNGVWKYCWLPLSRLWFPIVILFPPKTAELGHDHEIQNPTAAVATIKQKAKNFPTIFLGPCTETTADKKDNPLNSSSNFSRLNGVFSGDSRLIITRDELVMEKATRTPAETKSSRYSNGTNVAINVMIVPATIVPLRRFPAGVTSQNMCGSNPSRASAYCNRGCSTPDISTTIGRVITSPAAVNCAAHITPLEAKASGKPLSTLISV